jgi:carbonic anhydrase
LRLEEILQRNRRYTKGRPRRALPAPEPRPLTVLACFDPRLDDMLLPALGLGAEEAFLFRAAGGYVAPASTTLRSLMVAVLMMESSQLLVVGHSSCRMANFETSAFIDAFRARGVPRDAFGSEDLRQWAGAIASPRRGVELSMRHIISEPSRPKDLSVSGLLLDDSAATLEIVGETVPGGEVQLEPDAVEDTPPPVPEPENDPDDPFASAVDDLASLIRSNARWRYESQRLRRELASDEHAAAKLRALSSFATRAGADVAEILKAFERVRALASRADGTLDAEAISAIFPHLVEKL